MILRLAIALGPVVALTVSGLDADLPPGWLLALVVVVSSGHAFLPESGLGTFGLLLVLAWWGLGPVAELGAPPASIMLAAAALVIAHCAAILAAYGPGDLPLDRGLVVTWVRRGTVAVAIVPVIWFVAVAVEGQPEPAGVWVAALVASTVAAVVASVALVIEEEEVDR